MTEDENTESGEWDDKGEQEQQQTLNIYQRIQLVMQEISYIKKGDDKVNNMYSFVSHDEVTARLHPLMVKHGIVCMTSITNHAQDGNRTEATITLTFVNVDSPADKVEVGGFGYGIDPQDKGPGKAVSYAVKVLLLKTFLLETGERDNEADLIDHVGELETAIKTHQDSINYIKEGIVEGDLHKAVEAWDELDDQEKESLWVAPSKGGPFTTEERKVMKSTEFRLAREGKSVV